jgi:predicted TIM-barrel fold metal-dependent hydrolase
MAIAGRNGSKCGVPSMAPQPPAAHAAENLLQEISMSQRPTTAVKANADDARHYWLEEGRSAGGFIREIDHSAYAKGVHPLFEGIKIVDCDTHFTEPPDLFTANAPAGMKDKLPRVVRVDGADRWFVGDRDFGSLGGNVIAKDRNKLLGKLAFKTYDEIHPASYSVKERLQEMDQMGIWAQICFQNGGLTQAGSLVALDDDELAISIIRMFNDACAQRMKDSGGRINCMGTLPYWDRGLMVAELKRIIDLGLKGIVVPDRPERLSEGYVGANGGISPFWEEAFDICSAAGLPLNFHINSSLDTTSAVWDNLKFTQKLPITAMLHTVGVTATMSNFMVSGILDKYENLKIGLIESGIGWAPFVLEMLEHQFDEMRTVEDHGLKRRPKEYFAKNFWVSYWFETYAPKHMLHEIGVDRIMFETDFPHPTSLYPGVQEQLVATLGEHDYETRKRILERNAAELYNFDF